MEEEAVVAFSVSIGQKDLLCGTRNMLMTIMETCHKLGFSLVTWSPLVHDYEGPGQLLDDITRELKNLQIPSLQIDLREV